MNKKSASRLYVGRKNQSPTYLADAASEEAVPASKASTAAKPALVYKEPFISYEASFSEKAGVKKVYNFKGKVNISSRCVVKYLGIK